MPARRRPGTLSVTDLEFRDVEPPEQRLRSDACCSGGFFDIHLQTQTAGRLCVTCRLPPDLRHFFCADADPFNAKLNLDRCSFQLLISINREKLPDGRNDCAKRGSVLAPRSLAVRIVVNGPIEPRCRTASFRLDRLRHPSTYTPRMSRESGDAG